jgi:hypothetical protein
MPNRGNLTQSLSINGSITLLEGYYIGGTISQSVPTKGAATINPSNVTQTIGANQYLTGIQTINPVTFDASKVLVGTMIANTAGAMPNNGNQSTILNITDASKPTKSIASGYSSDSVITAQLDPSLASKILENNIIGGVAGTAKSAIVFTSGTNHQYQDALAPYETYTSTISPTRFKAVTVRVAGMYRVQFSMWWNSGSPLYSDYIHGQIYKNGSPYGTERSTYQNSGQAYAENLYFDIGDTIALYFWCLTSSTLPFKVGNFFLDTAELPLIEKII